MSSTHQREEGEKKGKEKKEMIRMQARKILFKK
jgi:hypothetical protein